MKQIETNPPSQTQRTILAVTKNKERVERTVNTFVIVFTLNIATITCIIRSAQCGVHCGLMLRYLMWLASEVENDLILIYWFIFTIIFYFIRQSNQFALINLHCADLVIATLRSHLSTHTNSQTHSILDSCPTRIHTNSNESSRAIRHSIGVVDSRIFFGSHFLTYSNCNSARGASIFGCIRQHASTNYPCKSD